MICLVEKYSMVCQFVRGMVLEVSRFLLSEMIENLTLSQAGFICSWSNISFTWLSFSYDKQPSR